MLNAVQLIGNLGRDVECRSMQNGDRVATFSLATTERWKDKAGERREKTTWHNIVVFNPNLVTIAEKYLRKGSKAFVQGQISVRDWTDKDGNKRTAFEIVLPRFGGQIVLLDGRSSDDGERREERTQQSSRETDPFDLNDEVPF